MISDAIKAGASAARDVLALCFTPVMTGVLCWLIAILAYGAWAANTQAQRINFLGMLALCLAALVGLGGQWFQRNRVKKLQVEGPAGIGGNFETEADAPEPDPGPTVKTTTTTEVKP